MTELRVDWNDVIKKEASGFDGADLGEQGLVVTKTDLVDKYTFYFPQILVDRFDGSLYLNRKLELQ